MASLSWYSAPQTSMTDKVGSPSSKSLTFMTAPAGSTISLRTFPAVIQKNESYQGSSKTLYNEWNLYSDKKGHDFISKLNET